MTSTSIYQEPVLSYVYRLDHPTTKEFYFGFRKANKVPASQDLGTEYFTSSKYVEPRFHEFNYTIIQEFVDPLEAYDLEQFLIYQELKNPLMMNRRCYYGSKSRFTTTGKSTSQETKYKLSAVQKGKKHSQETKAKQSAARKGKKMPPRTADHCANISASIKGIPQSEEHKAKISAAMKGKNTGPHSEERKANNSAAQKGISRNKGVPKPPRTAEHSAKIVAGNKGTTRPEFFSLIETRKTYRKGTLSRWHPEFKQFY